MKTKQFEGSQVLQVVLATENVNNKPKRSIIKGQLRIYNSKDEN